MILFMGVVFHDYSHHVSGRINQPDYSHKWDLLKGATKCSSYGFYGILDPQTLSPGRQGFCLISKPAAREVLGAGLLETNSVSKL